jgi:hypothetical protein
MSSNNPEELLSSVYEHWDLVSEEEKEKVAKMDDKFEIKGSLGAHEIKTLRQLLKDIRNRNEL